MSVDISEIVVIFNKDGKAHLGIKLTEDGPTFTYEKCNIDQIQDREKYSAIDLVDAVKTVRDLTLGANDGYCELCWPKNE